MTTTPDLAAARSGAGSAAEVARLHAATEPDFARYEVLKDIVDECIDLSLNYRQSGHPGRLALQGPSAARLAALRGHALGHSPSLAAVRRPIRALRRAHGAPRLLHARRAQRGSASASRSERRSALCLSRRRSLGPDLGVAARAASPRRVAGARRRWRGGPCSSSSTPGRPGTAWRRRPVRRSRSSWPARRRSRSSSWRAKVGSPPGAAHETKNIAWGLGLSNLVFLVDWNDFGIDPRACLERGARYAGRLVRALRLAGHRH